MDNEKYIKYQDNDNFVLFWNIAKCTYKIISPILNFDEYNYYLLKGFILSFSSKIDII